MDFMRLRLPELLTDRKPPLTPHAVAVLSGGRINRATLYRIVRAKGRIRLLDTDLLEALCDVLDLEPGELLEREKKRGKAK
jgi:DNA-binding Xre family transcriptional regulator